MRIVFRCDASVALGSGHVMRCLTLADSLKARGAEVLFVCRRDEGDLNDMLEGRGYPVLRLEGVSGWEEDAEATVRALAMERGEWLVLDHYQLGEKFERRLRPFFSRILVIDDLGRPHDCDLLLDQNLQPEGPSRYQGLIPAGCRRLEGPRYALLRPEFRQARRMLEPRDGTVRRILVSFGGSDPTCETTKALEALTRLGQQEVALDVVVGASNPYASSLEKLSRSLPGSSFHLQARNMAELMAGADLALGGGGSTAWERCYLGLPALAVVVAENQRAGTEAAAAAGALWNLGWHAEVTADTLVHALKACLDDPCRVRAMGLRALELMGEPSEEHPLVRLMMGEEHEGTPSGT